MTQQPHTTHARSLRRYWRQGEPLVWVSAAMLTLTLLLVAGLIVVVMANGLRAFWPAPLARMTLADGSRVLGQVTGRQPTADRAQHRLQLKIANRDLYGMDFRWIDESAIKSTDYPADAVALERREHGNFHGFLVGIKAEDGKAEGGVASPDQWNRLQAANRAVNAEAEELRKLHDRMTDLARRREAIRLKIRGIQNANDASAPARIQPLETEGKSIDAQFAALNQQAGALAEKLRGNEAVFRDAAGTQKAVALVDIVRVWRPNAMSSWEKIKHYVSKIAELITDDPREANTEGGLAPAIFGTVMMVFLMSLFCIPLGVVAAVYLREYAKEGVTVRLVRIAVNNLAGVPSIVYGIFGLGFFVYGLGGAIDRVFFAERLPAPTFGTGGLLWASLTLALLTVPVVIVATEEALAAVPRGIREGSLALGATKFQTLIRILLPMASPGIMTGLVLAIARAAGEVAPLMIVGVVKLAPALPLDGQFPFLHLERKFMHLGFHIYDVGFQSPNVEAAKPMVFVTTLLLLAIVIVMSALAIVFRNRMRRKYTTGAF